VEPVQRFEDIVCEDTRSGVTDIVGCLPLQSPERRKANDYETKQRPWSLEGLHHEGQGEGVDALDEREATRSLMRCAIVHWENEGGGKAL
jgi:hypothetical protein